VQSLCQIQGHSPSTATKAMKHIADQFELPLSAPERHAIFWKRLDQWENEFEHRRALRFRRLACLAHEQAKKVLAKNVPKRENDAR
jgi:hypothetical protein